MLRLLRVRYARARMAAYVNGELPPKTRRFIARIIDEDAGCYQAYLAQRRVHQEMHRTLPLVGRPQQGQLDTLWSQISAEIATPEPAQVLVSTRPPRMRYSWGYGVAAAFIVLLLALPYGIGAGAVSASAAPEQPEPLPLVTQEAPSFALTISATQTAVALYTETEGTQIARNDLHNTPAVKTPGR